MSLTLPAGLADVASLAGVPGELFALDEDALKNSATALDTFVGQTAPSLQETNDGAARYTAASGGAATLAFTKHWNEVGPADSGGAGQTFEQAHSGAQLLHGSAEAVKIAKVGVLTCLVWLARKRIIALAAGGAGKLIEASATMWTRQAVKKVWEKLTKYLSRAGTKLAEMKDALRVGSRPRFAGEAGVAQAKHVPGDPYQPRFGSEQMNMGKNRDQVRNAQEMAARRQGKADDLREYGDEDGAAANEKLAQSHQNKADQLRREDS